MLKDLTLELIYNKYVTYDAILDSYQLTIYTLSLLLFFEYISWSQEWHTKVTQNKKIRDLYIDAWQTSLHHFLILGPVSYWLAYIVVMEIGTSDHFILSIIGVFTTQSLGYAYMHNWMHKSKNYWIHKYHHGYSELTFVRPVSANATTTIEFLLAYALPLVVGIMTFRPSITIVFRIVMSISLTNLLIHTPPETIGNMSLPVPEDTPSTSTSTSTSEGTKSKKKKNSNNNNSSSSSNSHSLALLLPLFIRRFWNTAIVTNVKHFHHHEQDVKKHYSAPIFDIDSLLGFNKKKSKTEEATSTSASGEMKTCPASGLQGTTCPVGFGG